MFGIALSVSACLRAGTRVDVAWIVNRSDQQAFDPAEAVAITPGGGHLGSLLSGALDGQLGELAGIRGGQGRVVTVDVSPADSAISGVPTASGISCALVPGADLPEELWDLLLAREPVCLVSRLVDDAICDTSIYTQESISEAPDHVSRIFNTGATVCALSEHELITTLWPTPTMIIVGQGDIADALARLTKMLGWKPVATTKANDAIGLIATLAQLDSVVVLGHDLELTGAALKAALSGAAGYVGSIGPMRLQRARADWLAYRGVTDLSRLSAPAGLDIGARNPPEIALAVAAEIVAAHASSSMAAASDRAEQAQAL